jgi:DNA repair protein RecN (Recombination protein N)
MNKTPIDSVSSGEFNRIRLAIFATRVELAQDDTVSVLIFDEIDANISGDESMQVAKLIKFLSSKYQIFAISHQPHLSSLADRHFLVSKEGNSSIVIELDIDSRVNEIARIISGADCSIEAIGYAKKMLGV